MRALQAPPHGRAWRHVRVFAPDHMVDLEPGIGEGGAQAHPEPVGVRVAIAGNSALKEKTAGPVKGGRNGRDVRAHDAGQDNAMTRAPCVVIAAPLVAAGLVGGRSQRARGRTSRVPGRAQGAMPRPDA